MQEAGHTYRPKTNRKAERFIQTSLGEWAYARAYNTSNERAAELPTPVTIGTRVGIKYQTLISRLGLTGNNLLSLHTYPRGAAFSCTTKPSFASSCTGPSIACSGRSRRVDIKTF